MSKTLNLGIFADDISVDNNRDVTLSNLRSDQPMMFRNRIINGDMRIDQRNAGASVSLNTTAHTLDRWRVQASGLDEASLNVSQYSMNASDLNSTGFSNALKVEVGTAESSIAADEYVSIQQRIEAQNLTDLKFGTASAKSLMLSFWVKTSLTGTYGITLEKIDTTATRLINKSFTTLTTDWEKVTIPIAGDIDSSALISDDNGEGFRLSFWLGVGSDYTTSSSNSWINYSDPYWAGTHQQNAFLTTQNATFYITGVQFEEGSVPTPFEHRPYGTELALCQRYYQKFGNLSYAGIAAIMQTNITTLSKGVFILHNEMRSGPSISFSNLIVTDRINFDTDVSNFSGSVTSSNGIFLNIAHASSGAVYRPLMLAVKNLSSGFLAFESEL